MAHFYGNVFGGASVASRTGTKGKGLITRASAGQGELRVKLAHDAGTGLDTFEVRMRAPGQPEEDALVLITGTFTGEGPVYEFHSLRPEAEANKKAGKLLAALSLLVRHAKKCTAMLAKHGEAVTAAESILSEVNDDE